ncbi:MAG: peptidoglycan-binding domain-containing protein [Pseudomonadota bacterium]
MNFQQITKAGMLAGALILGGCAAQQQETVVTSNSDDSMTITKQQQEIAELKRAMADQERALRNAQSQSATMTSASTAGMSSELFPPNAQAGRCYARILTPAKYDVSTETVLAKQASERVEILPAKFETVTERVVVREASSRLEVIPATFETVEERVLVKPASKRIEQVPATFKTASERILVTPARSEWKRGPATSFSGVVDSRTTDTGEIMCLVEIPAVYKTVTQQVVDRPATTREVTIPAVYDTIKKTVMVKPATTREITIPAEYDTIKVTREVSPASERRIAIPAKYTEVTKRKMISDAVLDWREVVCDVNLNRSNVTQLQTALEKKGYYKAGVDGVFGPATLSAANAYAKASGLPVGSNYIAIDVAKSLGLKM